MNNPAEQIEYCYARGWTDGLPVIPATRDLVRDMLDAAELAPDAVIAEMPSRKVAVTAEKVAINAVMAGCRPEYMPVVAAAVKALATPEFGLHHVASALSGPTIVILVNGPIAQRLGINATNNLFGPGVRANATIGRALRLLLLNGLKYRPGVSDRATMGTP
ncbi:MAG TPA: UGSC family (seleno)protein, partial [Burkholderiales bacterium]|nr:UGSC family (seleno)protein [Burkholderiales bacterium]